MIKRSVSEGFSGGKSASLARSGAILAAFLGMEFTRAASAAVIVQENYTTGSPTAAPYVEEAGGAVGTWTLTNGVGYVASMTPSSSNSVSGSLSYQTGLGGAGFNTNFTESVNFTLSSSFVSDGSSSHFGLVALASQGSFGVVGGGSTVPNFTGYSADLIGNGNIRLQFGALSGNTTPATATFETLTSTDLYTATFSGSYTSSSSLTLSFSVTDDTTSAVSPTITATDTPTPNTGSYFGVRMAIANNSSTGMATADSYSLQTVPEPASIGLLALGAVGLLGRRRVTR